jgi:hypothetical protein
VREVDQLQNSVNHRVAKSDQSVNASQTDPIDKMLYKILHGGLSPTG